MHEGLRAASGARIRVLDEAVRNQIAAGEVVERPASVVKELVENAFDAGARELVVDLEEGGVRLVRVQDDGLGMPAADLELAFVAHATSKLREVHDLEHVASLGFRGEALASIGSVARCRIVARERGATGALAIECEGGRLSPVASAAGREGTCVEVRDLFYNVPARRRFLKTTSTELARCLDVLQRAVLAHEGVGLRVSHDGKRVLDVEAGLDLRGRVRRIFGAELAMACEPVEARDGTTELTGLVAPPRFARSDSSRQMWFVNGRAVRDKVLLRALKEAYRGFVFDARQPCAVLHLAIDPSLVDVNVHPQKSEVRFRDERRLVGFLIHSLRDAVKRTDMATPGGALLDTALRREARTEAFDFDARGRASTARDPIEVYEVAPRSFAPGASQPWSGADAERGSRGTGAERASDVSSSEHELAPRAPLSPLATSATPERSAGISGGTILQIARTFLVRATENGFEIADQHALHERITFEALLREWKRGGIEIQRLAFPDLVEVTRAEAELVTARTADLARAGLEIEPFGATTLALRGLPARLARPRPEAIVKDLVALLEEQGDLAPERLFEEMLHRAACRSSVMAGDALSQAEMEELFARGAKLESDQTCVHGRPTRVRFTVADLEKAFARR